MKQITVYVKGDKVQDKRSGKALVIVARWAKGEGHGYACKVPGQPNHECRDYPAVRLAPR